MPKFRQLLFCVLLGWLVPISAQAQVANVLSSVGAANRGAATAMPLDASNSQDWNPGSITDLPETELDLNVQPSFPHIDIEASIPAGSITQQTPSTTIAGGVGDGNRFNWSPSIGFVKKREDSPWAYGVLTAATFGAGVEFSGKNNPLTSPPPPRGVGSGEIKVFGDLYYLAPTLARRLTKNWSVGVQPNFVLASLQASPFASVEPDDANQDGIPTYPKTNRAWSFGVGVKGGIYYRHKNIRLGVSYKSPTWFTPYHFKSQDELGRPRNFSASINGPMILSMGTGYSGIPRTHLAFDVRHVNYESTTGFDKSGFTKGGASRGLGWRNVWAYVGSIQYQVTKKIIFRAAYSFSNTPVIPNDTSGSIASPALVEHQMSVALAYRIHPSVALAVSYQHGFAHSSEGPINRLQGPIPGSKIKETSSLDSVAASVVFLFK
jgi:long-chain fatty acid transport protein